MNSSTFRRWILLLFLLVTAGLPSWAADDEPKPDPAKADDIARAVQKAVARSRDRHHGIAIGNAGSDVRVEIGQSVIVQTNETIENVVIVFGDATIDGAVKEEVVVVGGDARINGKVGENVVAVLGQVILGPQSEVGGDVVGVGGGVDRAEGAKVGGEIVPVDISGVGGFKLQGLRSFIRYCVLELRPLSFKVGWVWWVAGAFLLGYVLLCLAFPRGVEAGMVALEEKPALSLLLGILAKPLVGIIALLLAITGIGVIVVPFLLAGLFVAAFFGKAAVMRYLGHQFGRQLHTDQLQRPIIALLLGAAILTLFYLIPFVGLAVWAVSSMWGMGAILMALGSRFRREAPSIPQPAAAAPTPGWASPLAITPMPAATGPTPMTTTATVTATTAPTTLPTVEPGSPVEPAVAAQNAPPPIGAAGGPAPATGLAGAPSAPEAWTLPRVGFWRRALATLLDSILLGVLTGVMHIMPAGFILWVAYYAGMWAWRGTTIGGIVVGIKVVRLDGRPMDFATALVRALGAVFSTIVFGLGYFWAGWDREKQGWHDKIAGTVVVRVPHGQALVMF
jgi:uncharacterized RDD family membrane protein YckC